ncbi:XdhC family protein [Actinoplanes sp. TRM 88003]|uniref:XdhC family protein n=1 Tax=Paractinoplanes aksuensis TaxID=2939490 RepID=A0ABT1DP34_9ACTN|nr:XdhC family protein [Actinoplanes aksuensis]MCO8271836.1 XdhC family protein [Actinoplanes aksuensis]
MSLVAERVADLAQARRPFVHATVVRAQEPTSARPGDDAVILADGSIEGFVGGVCAESSVRAAALDTLKDGNTLLLRVLPEDNAAFPESPGALVVVNPCHSGGAIEIFLRPVLPKPLLGVVGSTPISRAVASLAEFLDFEVTPASAYEGAAAVVVAGLGRDEERAIRAALDAGVAYVALVSSHKRGAVVLDGMGLTPAERDRVRPHAGLDIGARTPKEIALSILAEVVRELRANGMASPDDMVHPPEPDGAVSTVQGYPQATDTIKPNPAIMTSGGSPREGGLDVADDHAAAPSVITISASPPRQAVDPVCGMTVFIDDTTPHAVVDGEDYWFCRVGCRDSFVAG